MAKRSTKKAASKKKAGASSSRRTASADKPELDASMRIVIIHGPEEMRKREAYESLKAALDDQHGELDPITFDGKTAVLADVLDELRTFGLLQSHKLVVVDEADQFVTRYREKLEAYAQSPCDNATLVLRSVNWRPGNLDKAVARVGAKVTCKPLSPDAAARWLTQRAKAAHNTTLTADAAGALVQRLGVDLMRLDAELGKLIAMAGPGQRVDRDLIDAVVARSSDEQAWAVQEAVLNAIAASASPARAAMRRPAADGGPPADAAPSRRRQALRRVGQPLLEKLHELIDVSGQPEVLVSYAVIDLARKLHLGVQMKKQGAQMGLISKKLRLFGPGQRTFMTALDRISPAGAARLFDEAVAADRRGKSGLGDVHGNLECLCALLADECT